MIQSCCLIFRRNVAMRTRLLAFGSLLSMFYFCFMTFTVTALCWFEILPNVYRTDYDKLQWHRCLVAFLFTNAVGNCILVLGTGTDINRISKKTLKAFKVQTLRRKRQTKKGDDKEKTTNPGNGIRCRKKEDYSELSTDEETTRTSTACAKCQYRCPARSHHCIICDTCVLKRDHHCFFMTVCIGYFNQKYFIMYCFYMFLGTFYGMTLIVIHMKALFNTTFYGPQTFVVLLYELLVMLWTGTYPGGKYVFLLLTMYGCLTAGLLAAALWFWQIQIALSGQTTHEVETGVKKYASKSKYKNFLDVFGKFWILNFFAPLPLPQYSNGLYLDQKHS